MRGPVSIGLLVLLGLWACSQPEPSEVQAGWNTESGSLQKDRETRILVVGHVMDRATGNPIGGARIEAPGGRTAVSDARGYFEIAGFSEGEQGSLKAFLGKERMVETQLRPLRPGKLEVVLHLGP